MRAVLLGLGVFISILSLLFASGGGAVLRAEDDVCGEVADRIRHGGVIWTENAVVVQGTAAPDLSDPTRSVSVIKAISKRAATLDAYRKAAGILSGVRVTSEMIGADNPRVVSDIQAHVQNAAVCKAKYYADGGVDVVVWLPITGAFAADQMPGVGAGEAVAPSQFSSVIVDASALPFAPALAPRLLSAQGAVVFDQRRVNPAVLRRQGAVIYVQSLEDIDPAVVGDTPLQAHAVALGARSPSDLVLDDEAAGVLADGPAFLGKGSVLIVTGPPRQIDCRGLADVVTEDFIDWENRLVLARGHGRVDFSRPLDDAVRMRMMERAAEVDAERKLLEAFMRVKITGRKRLKETPGASDRVGGVIVNAVRCGARYFRDGSAEVVLAAPLDGLAVAGDPAAGEPASKLVAAETGASGLIVDARGVAFEPVLSPRILGPQNRVLYGPDIVSRAYVRQYGTAGYSRTPAAARADARIGDNPLTVAAAGAAGDDPGSLILGPEDARRVEKLLGTGGPLTQGRVIIVIDGKAGTK